MSKTLEEKKNELVKSYAENYYDDLCGVLTDTLDHNNDKWLRDVIKIAAASGFDAGIKAYKEMLEGEYPESRSVYACRLILAEAKLQQQAEKITSLESRLKEAESVIENLTGHAEASIQFPHKDKTDLVVAAYIARQYMEKVK